MQGHWEWRWREPVHSSSEKEGTGYQLSLVRSTFLLPKFKPCLSSLDRSLVMSLFVWTDHLLCLHSCPLPRRKIVTCFQLNSMLLKMLTLGFFSGPVVKNSPANADDAGSIPGSRRFSWRRKWRSTQYSCLGNPMDRGVWWATVHRVSKELDMT